LLAAADAARSVLSASDVLPGVTDIVSEVKVEAVFDDGTRLIVVRDPFRLLDHPPRDNEDHVIPGQVLPASVDPYLLPAELVLEVLNTSEVPISITSHFHFFETNSRLRFDRKAAYGMRLAIPAGSSLRFDQGVVTPAPMTPIRGDRVAIGFAGLVDGPLDDLDVRLRAYERATTQGFLGMDA
jgi:urease subunit gamma/beta